MGMYTELVLAVKLNDELLSWELLQLLEYMMTGDGDEPKNLPNHPLFKTSRWNFMLISDSYYFTGKTDSKMVYDGISGYSLQIRCNLKNYDNEIEHFIDWIGQFIPEYEKGFAGYKRYEEDQEPTLIFFKEGDNE